MGLFTFKFSGLNRVSNNVKAMSAAMVHNADQALLDEAENIFQRSQGYVPVVTGKLKASGRIEKQGRISRLFKIATSSGGEVIYEILYGNSRVGYALKVHENPNSTGYKYLERAMNEQVSGMDRRIASKLFNFGGVDRVVTF